MNRNFGRWRPCPICGSREKSTLAALTYALFDDSPLHPQCDIVGCTFCGCCYANSRVSEKALNTYYKQNAYYFSATTTGSGGNSLADCARFEHTAQCIARHCRSSSSPIFDIGCGKGGLLDALKAQGFTNLFAVDPLKECCTFVAANGYRVGSGSARRLPFTEHVPGVLVYSHVLEHLLEPAQALAHAHNRLTDSGLVYLEVPDALHYGTYVSPPLAELYMEHLIHFDRHHLDMLAARCGFEPVETGSKILDVNGRPSAPCLYGIYRKSSHTPPAAPGNEALKASLLRYLNTGFASPLFNRFNALAASRTPLHIWGISQYAQLLLGSTKLSACTLASMVDGDTHKQSKTIGGMPIQSPEALVGAKRGDAILLTGIHYQEQMRAFLRQIDFKGEEIVVE